MNVLIVILLTFCVAAPFPPTPVTDRPDLKRFFDAEKVSGSFLLYDQKKDAYVAYQYDRCQQGFLPASTFKIINTLIGLETDVIPDSSYVIKWDGKMRGIANWNRNHTLASAFRVSCVPCYQELARCVGPERMNQWVQKAHYGQMDIRPDNIDTFWLTGNSRISQKEEVDFLRRLYRGAVPFSARNLAQLKGMMLLDNQPAYKLYGKTGWATSETGDKPAGPDIGWFVGYVEMSGTVYFFATNIEARQPVPDNFISARRRITEQILSALGVMPVK